MSIKDLSLYVRRIGNIPILVVRTVLEILLAGTYGVEGIQYAQTHLPRLSMNGNLIFGELEYVGVSGRLNGHLVRDAEDKDAIVSLSTKCISSPGSLFTILCMELLRALKSHNIDRKDLLQGCIFILL